jgi:hypothetical protein
MRWHPVLHPAGLLLALPGQAQSVLEEASRLLDRMAEANARIADLRCEFHASVLKGSRAFPPQRAILRYRARPETVHLTFLEPCRGRVVRYGRDLDGGKLRVRPEGLLHFTTLSLDPLGARAMAETLDPITVQGFPNIVAAARQLLETARRTGSPAVSLEALPGSLRLAFRSATDELTLEVDPATFLPGRVTRRRGGDSARYRYERIEVNPGLAESDFDL